MTYLDELYRKFDLELDKSTGISSYPSFLPEEKDYWLNTSIMRIIKTKYSGLNVHRDGFGQSQKRLDDLRTLVKKSTIQVSTYDVDSTYDENSVVCVIEESAGTVKIVEYRTAAEDNTNDGDGTGSWKNSSSNGPNRKYIAIPFEYPSDYMIGLGDSVKCRRMDNVELGLDGYSEVTFGTEPIETSIENIDSKLNSHFPDYAILHGTAKPLKLYVDGLIELYTSPEYWIERYTMTYIKYPEKLDLYKYPEYSATANYSIGDKVRHNGIHYEAIVSITSKAFNPASFKKVELLILPDHMWDEIIVNAVRLALENISEQRYQTYSSESQVIE